MNVDVGIIVTVVLAGFGVVWRELLGIRKRLHELEGSVRVAGEILDKYKLMRREDRDPVLDEKIDGLHKK